MQVVPNVQGKTLKGLAEKALRAGAMIHTGGFRSYLALSEKGFDVQGIKFDPKNNPDEFCYRFNRRHFDGNFSIAAFQLRGHTDGHLS